MVGLGPGLSKTVIRARERLNGRWRGVTDFPMSALILAARRRWQSMTKNNTRRPGRRSHLPSRTTTSRKLFRLTNIDFASDEVRRPLIDAGWSGGNDLEGTDLEGFQLSNDVREIVSDYLADRTVSLPEFRNRVVKFARALEGLLKKFPDDETSACRKRDYRGNQPRA